MGTEEHFLAGVLSFAGFGQSAGDGVYAGGISYFSHMYSAFANSRQLSAFSRQSLRREGEKG